MPRTVLIRHKNLADLFDLVRRFQKFVYVNSDY